MFLIPESIVNNLPFLAKEEIIKETLDGIADWECLAQIDPTENNGEDIRQGSKKDLEQKLQELFPEEILSESILPNGLVVVSFAGITVEKNAY